MHAMSASALEMHLANRRESFRESFRGVGQGEYYVTSINDPS